MKVQGILDILRERGPLTAQALADIVYPDGDGFIESWDLAASEKIEMDLGHLGHAVEVVGQAPSEWGGTDELWAATTPERAAELLRQTRHLRAVWLWETRLAIRRGEADPLQIVSFGQERGWSKWRRGILAVQTPADREAEAVAFNSDRRERIASLMAHRDRLAAELDSLRRP